MTQIEDRPIAIDIGPVPITPPELQAPPKGSLFGRLLRTTDHQLIGRMYIVTSLLMRAELARPGRQSLSQEQYNQRFTMHGTAMLLFFATPMVFAFANLVVPLQIGSPDVAFPRLNAFSYWLFLFGAITALSGASGPTCGSAAWGSAGWARSWPRST